VTAANADRRRIAGPIAATALFTLLATVIFDRVLFRGEAFFSQDVAPFFYPMKHFLATSVRAGQLPLWNPWVAGGEPFFASLQPGLLYPGSLVLYVVPMPAAFDILVALHYPLAGTGMALLLRRWNHGWPGAVLGGTAFMLGGFFVSVGNFVNNLQTVAWLPWVFLAWDRVLDQRRIRDLVVFAVACGVAFLGGEPQMLALGLVVIFAHGLLRVEGRGLGSGAQTAAFAAAGALAVAVVAVQLLPFAEYMGHSVRRLPIELTYAASRSLEPAAAAHFLVPPALRTGAHGFSTRYLAAESVPWLVSVYSGGVALALAVVGAVSIRSRRWALFWAVTAAIGFTLALGIYSPLYRALFAWLPPFRAFRYPEKSLLLVALAFAVATAHGTDRWLALRDETGARSGRRRTWAAIGGVAFAYGLLAAWLRLDGQALGTACAGWLTGALLCDDPATARELYLGIAFRVAALVAALVAVTWLYMEGRLRKNLAVALLVALVAGDLIVAHRDVNPSVDETVYQDPPWAARVLDERMEDRLAGRYRGSPHDAAMGSIVTVRGAWELTNMYLDYQTMGPNVGQLFGFPMQDGLQGVELIAVAVTNEAALRSWSDDQIRFLRAMNVQYYADATGGADTIPGLIPVASHPEMPIRIYEVPEPAPRAYLASRYEQEESPARALRRVLEDDFPLGGSVVVSDEPSPAPDSTAAGRVVERKDENGRVTLRVVTDAPMLAVLSDRHYPGWRVRVDGKDAPLLLANGVFRAAAVPAGSSEVEFRYDPVSLKLGALISVVGLLVASATWVRAGGRTL
jgi:hypothetical protein